MKRKHVKTLSRQEQWLVHDFNTVWWKLKDTTSLERTWSSRKVKERHLEVSVPNRLGLLIGFCRMLLRGQTMGDYPTTFRSNFTHHDSFNLHSSLYSRNAQGGSSGNSSSKAPQRADAFVDAPGSWHACSFLIVDMDGLLRRMQIRDIISE